MMKYRFLINHNVALVKNFFLGKYLLSSLCQALYRELEAHFRKRCDNRIKGNKRW